MLFSLQNGERELYFQIFFTTCNKLMKFIVLASELSEGHKEITLINNTMINM